MQFKDWLISSRQGYDDPREYSGIDIDYCKNCQMHSKHDDTDVCEECIDNFEEQKQTSLCCSDTLAEDINRCTSCYEWSESMFDEYCKKHNFNKNTYRYE